MIFFAISYVNWEHSWLLFHTFHIGLEAKGEMKDCFARLTSSSTLLMVAGVSLDIQKLH